LLLLFTAPPPASQCVISSHWSARSSSSSAFWARRTQHATQQHAHKQCTTMLTPLPGGSGGDPYAAIIKDCAAATKAAMQVCKCSECSQVPCCDKPCYVSAILLYMIAFVDQHQLYVATAFNVEMQRVAACRCLQSTHLQHLAVACSVLRTCPSPFILAICASCVHRLESHKWSWSSRQSRYTNDQTDT
jgi:hypothetical protein